MSAQRVLVVDDDAAALQVTRAHLESAGFEVLTRDGAFGTSAYILREQPDVVVLDVDMPGLRGDKIAELLTKNPSRRVPKLILYSSLDEEELRAAAQRCGAIGYVTKTGLIGNLVRAVERCLGQAQSNRPAPDPSPPSRSTGVLDASIVDELRSLETPGRPGFLRELVDAYLHEARAQITVLGESLARSDFSVATSAAHKLKGSSRNVGANRLADECADLEHLIRSSNASAAIAQLDRVKAHLAEAERALEQLAAS